MHRTFIVVLLLLVFASACGGSGAQLAPAAGLDKSSALVGDEADARFKALMDNPGLAGIDYDPRKITVGYIDGAILPPGLSQAPAGLAARAAAQRNAILRKDRQYEALTDAIAARYGLSIDNQIYLEGFNVAAFDVPAGADFAAVLEQLRSEFASCLEYAGFSQYLQQSATINDPDYSSTSPYPPGPQWGHRKVHLDEAFDFTTGDASVRVAVVDTGVRITHQELTAQVLDPQAAFPSQRLDIPNNDNTMEDADGHGTFIAGIMGAQVNNSRTIAGVAYDCEIIPVKITNGGAASDADIYEGCLLADQLGAKSINLSFGDTHDDPYLEQMVNIIVNHGHLFVGAAGNNGSTTIEYPAGYTNSLCVGSTDPDDVRSSFSNYGSWVDIAAPGQWLKSCTPNGDNTYNDWVDGSGSGTSFAAPFVAAAAGLLWSFKPSMTVSEMRTLLTTTGADCSGFSNSAVQRLDIAAALTSLDTLRISAPEPARLVQHGELTLQPTLSLVPDSVSCYVDGELFEMKTAEPFTFTIDTSGITFGKLSVTFVAKRGTETKTDSVDLLIDNTAGQFPLQEDFETGGEYFKGIDVKNYNISLLQAIKEYDGPGEDWTQSQVQDNGAGLWTVSTTGGYSSQACARFGTPATSYENYETDALVSRQIDLGSATSPSLTFYHHYNIEDGGNENDRAYVCVTDNYGQTFTLVPLSDATPARYTGYSGTYALSLVDLSQFAGKKVHIVLVFESNAGTAGAQAGAAGWWVDHLVAAGGYATSVPQMSGVSLANWSVYGAVPQRPTLTISPVGASGVSKVRYLLDLDPVGTIAPPDMQVETTTSPFTGVLTLPVVPNQLAQVKVKCWGPGNVAGPEFTVPLYLFNQIGDANADNIVDAQDTALIQSLLGLTNADSGYSPFCDSNNDRVIDELDGAAVGYFWGASIPE